jgi:hypothetical protein
LRPAESFRLARDFVVDKPCLCPEKDQPDPGLGWSMQA